MTRLFAVVLFMVFLSLSSVMAVEPKVFKNTDLERYSADEGSGVAEPVVPATPADSVRQQQRRTENNEIVTARRWCEASAEADNRIKRAEEDLSDAKARKAQTWINLGIGNRMAAVEADADAQRDLERAEAEVADAKEGKERLQSEAHQKGIPPGWLRCQFE